MSLQCTSDAHLYIRAPRKDSYVSLIKELVKTTVSLEDLQLNRTEGENNITQSNDSPEFDFMRREWETLGEGEYVSCLSGSGVQACRKTDGQPRPGHPHKVARPILNSCRKQLEPKGGAWRAEKTILSEYWVFFSYPLSRDFSWYNSSFLKSGYIT